METENLTLKEKCYAYQKAVNYFLDPEKYIIAHIDGRSFSKMVKNKFNKPFDDNFIHAMNETAICLCEGVQGTQFAYVQSDEISLLIKKTTPKGQVFFGGRMCKLHSVIASIATSRFNQVMMSNLLESIPACANTENAIEMCIGAVKSAPLYQFDCKVWNVENANDAMAWFLFRNIDCIRNSKQQTCQTYLPQNVLKSKNTDEQVQLLKTNKGIDWNKFTDDKKFGRLVKKIVVTHTLGETPYERSKWEAFPFFDMTDIEKRENFIKEFNLIDENE